MDDIVSLIEMSDEDDSLLYSHDGGNQDLLSSDCSPLFQVSYPSPSLVGINEDFKSISTEVEHSSVFKDGAGKENADFNKFDTNKHKLDPQQMKKKKKEVNLRKSLAWDKAFFTDEGVLNPLELATLSGNATGSGELPEICEEDEEACDDLNSPISTMSNDTQEEKFLGEKGSIKPTIAPNCRLPLHPKPSSSKKIPPSSKAKRAVLQSSDLKAATREASSISVLPKPSAARIKLPPKSTKLPAFASNVEPKSRVISSGKMKENEIVKPRQPKPKATVSQQAKPRPTPVSSSSGPLNSLISKPSQTLKKTEVPSQGRIHTAKQKDKCTKETDKLLRSSSNSAAGSSGDHLAAPSILQKTRNIKNESAQVAKPSGLRMPSPSLGFFHQQSKAAADSGIVSIAKRKPPLPKKMPTQSNKDILMSSAYVNALEVENVHQDAELNALKEPRTKVMSQVKTKKAALSDDYDASDEDKKKEKSLKVYAMESNSQKCESPLPDISVLIAEEKMEKYVNAYSACEESQAMNTVSVLVAEEKLEKYSNIDSACEEPQALNAMNVFIAEENSEKELIIYPAYEEPQALNDISVLVAEEKMEKYSNIYSAYKAPQSLNNISVLVSEELVKDSSVYSAYEEPQALNNTSAFVAEEKLEEELNIYSAYKEPQAFNKISVLVAEENLEKDSNIKSAHEEPEAWNNISVLVAGENLEKDLNFYSACEDSQAMNTMNPSEHSNINQIDNSSHCFRHRIGFEEGMKSTSVNIAPFYGPVNEPKKYLTPANIDPIHYPVEPQETIATTSSPDLKVIDSVPITQTLEEREECSVSGRVRVLKVGSGEVFTPSFKQNLDSYARLPSEDFLLQQQLCNSELHASSQVLVNETLSHAIEERIQGLLLESDIVEEDGSEPFSHNLAIPNETITQTVGAGEECSESGRVYALKEGSSADYYTSSEDSLHEDLVSGKGLEEELCIGESLASSQLLVNEIKDLSSLPPSADIEENNSTVKMISCEDLNQVIPADLHTKSRADDGLIYSCDVKEEHLKPLNEFDNAAAEYEDAYLSSIRSQLSNKERIVNKEGDVVEENRVKQPGNDEKREDLQDNKCDSSEELQNSCDIDRIINQMSSLNLASTPSVADGRNEEDELCGDLLSFYMDLVSKCVDSDDMENEETHEKYLIGEPDEEQIPNGDHKCVVTSSEETITGKNIGAIKPPANAAPFSDEWLAAYEAAGEEALAMKSGAVQNSPNNTALPEPGPWSPVNRNQTLGPFDCTKFTTVGMPSPSPHVPGL